MTAFYALLLGVTIWAIGTVYRQEKSLLKIVSVFPSTWVERACLQLWRSGAEASDKALCGRLIVSAFLILVTAIALPSPFNYIPLLIAFLAITLYVQKSSRCQEQARAELIQMASSLSLSVAGGQDLSVAMAFYCENETGLLPDACTEALYRLRMGQSLENIFDPVQERYPVSREFFSAIKMSRKQGTPLAKVLKDQAVRWRQNRLTQMEARAQKLPVLLLGPLALCIFPNVFLILLGPYLLELL